MSWEVKETPAMLVVKVTFNDTEGKPGECLYGPFFTEDDADDFAQNWGADDTEIEDVEILHLNPIAKEDDDA